MSLSLDTPVSLTLAALASVIVPSGLMDRGGLNRGGWAHPYNDPVMGQVMGEGMAKTGALLLGVARASRLCLADPS